MGTLILDADEQVSFCSQSWEALAWSQCGLAVGRRWDAVLPLDRRVDDPVELYVGDRLIARGELQELDGEQAGQLAVRLIEVAAFKGGM